MKKRGSISIYCLVVMFMIITSSLGVMALASSSMLRVKSDKRNAISFQIAQAGLELGITQAASEAQTVDLTQGQFLPSSRNYSDTFSSIAPGSTVTVDILPSPDQSYAWITSTATVENKTKSVRTRLSLREVGIWNNAIFAGTGAVGQAINGNVDIRGSVHLLGDGENYTDTNHNAHWDAAEPFTDNNKNGVWDPGEPFADANGDGVWSNAEPYNDSNHNGFYDPPLTVTDMNSAFGGTAYLGNNYSGIPSGLESQIPALIPVAGIKTLNTEVRVKHGQISLSGNAKIGTNAEIDFGASKSTVDGTYVSDGFIGSAGVSSVFSDNGTTHDYDLDSMGIDFPLISGIGAQEYLSGGELYNTQLVYLQTKTLTIPVATIKSTTAAFSYGPDLNGNSISFTPASGGTAAVLDIHGVVRINGNLQLGSKDTVTYSGNGTIFAEGNINIDGNFLPKTGKVFPTTARVGMIAKLDINLATGNGSSQLTMAGAFYAQGKVVSRKQNQIAGTFVANSFDMGTNVPNIYQVPLLVKNMPPAMPGDKSMVYLQLKSWKERQ